MYYMDLSLLPADYEIVQNRDGEFICAPDGTLYKFQRNTDTYIQYEVDFINWDKLPKGWNRFQSQSGEFICDDEGRLRKWIPSDNNFLERSDTSSERTVKDLIIPEGVQQIGAILREEDALEEIRFITVLDEISFPASLKRIGDCSFANSFLPAFTFPVSLEKMQAFAFGGSRISKLIIPSNMKKVIVNFEGVRRPAQNPPKDELWIVGRDFKAAMIDTLVCSQDFERFTLMPEARIGQIIKDFKEDPLMPEERNEIIMNDKPIEKKHRKGLLKFLLGK